MIVNFYSRVDHRVIAHFNPIAEPGLWVDLHFLSDHTIFPDIRKGTAVTVLPHLAIIADETGLLHPRLIAGKAFLVFFQ
ncbi:hypothetical protein D3C86_2100830 [compost metagenome]